jgi:uncharacterized small protein (DUF1192 family)
MRDPITKFPQRPTGVAHSRRTLVEIQTVLKNPRLSPEMRTSLEQRVAALRTEIADASAPRGRDSSSSDSRDK